MRAVSSPSSLPPVTPGSFPIEATLAPMAEHVLAVASGLFYREGIHKTGVDRIIAEAGVAKMSLYKHFATKDELVVAFLNRRDERWCGWLESRARALGGTPRATVLAVFDALGEWFASDEFRGCAFINAAAEFADGSHAARLACAAHKARVRSLLERLCGQAQIKPATETAAQLALLIEGAIVTAQVEGVVDAAMRTRRMAEALLPKQISRAARLLSATPPRAASLKKVSVPKRVLP